MIQHDPERTEFQPIGVTTNTERKVILSLRNRPMRFPSP